MDAAENSIPVVSRSLAAASYLKQPMTADEWKEFGALWDSLLTDRAATEVSLEYDGAGDDDNEARTDDYEATISGVVAWGSTPLAALQQAAENERKVNQR